MNKILLIGGTDPSGAGLQADWQVVNHLASSIASNTASNTANKIAIQAHSVVTAVTAQNKKGVLEQGLLPISQIESQFRCLEDESFTAIKIGMLGNADVIRSVINFIQKQSNSPLIVLDPVLASSSGGTLLNREGIRVLISQLLPLVTLITPNILELESLVSTSINSTYDIEKSATKLTELGAKNVLLKGGHFNSGSASGNSDGSAKNSAYNNNDYSNDYFLSIDGSANIKGEEESFYLKGTRWQDKDNVRGTGCSLATAITCQLSVGFPLNDAIIYAKAFISSGIRNAIPINENQQKLLFINDCSQHPFKLKDMPRLVKDAPLLNQRYDFASCNSNAPKNSLGVYPVVDSLEWLDKLIALGIETIQLRIKDQTPKSVEATLIKAIELGHKHKVRLFINDYWQLAVKNGAYGIHLGQEDLNDADMAMIAKSGCRLGVSTHSYTEVARALQIDPSYIALGPIFATTSKDMPWIPQGVAAVTRWVDLLNDDYPLVAIGGINYARAEALKQTGIGSVAMISEITKANDYKNATNALLDLWKKDISESVDISTI